MDEQHTAGPPGGDGDAADVLPATRHGEGTGTATERAWSPLARRVVLALAIARFVVPILAIGYAARVLTSFGDLEPSEVVLLTLLRPAKETLLFAGGVYRVTGGPSPLLVFAAYVPLMVMAVWVFFLLGRMYASSLTSPDSESWLTRMVPPKYVRATQLLLVEKGPAVAIIGRVVAAPPTILAAAAGTTTVDALRYLVADAIGAVLSFAMIFGLGLALGEAYERAGPWVTGATFVLLFIGIQAGQRWFQRELERVEQGDTPDPAAA